LVSTGVGLTWETFPELFSGSYNDLTNKPSLFSGSYNDLTNKPAILNINLGVPENNQYLKFNGTNWINSDLPTIYQYDLSTSFNVNNGVASIVLSDQFFEQTSVSISGDNGITLSTTVNGDIVITAPTVSEYDADTAKDDISNMFLDGTNVGISYTYNPITKTINSTVSLAEQLIYTLYGFSDTPNEAKIYLDNGTTESGAVNIVGTNGINIAWDIGTSTLSFSKTDPTPYTLPVATTSTLGGVIPDSSDFNIDGLGNLTVNFPSGGIGLNDLSVGTEGSPSGNGDLSYDSATGQFTYTPPSFSLDNLNDVSIVDANQNQILKFNGTNWQNSDITIPTTLDNLTDVIISDPSIGDIISFNGSTWSNTSLNLTGSNLEDLGNVENRTNNNSGQILLWNGASWNPTVAKLTNFDISTLPTNGQTLQWNGTTNLWDPVGLSGGGATTLDGLTDVSVTGAAPGDYLYYNGSSWVNNSIPIIPEYLSDLLDVSDTAASNGYVLTWNSTALEWQPAVSGASPGAGLTSRTGASATTASIADGDYDTPNINGFKSYMLMKIQTNAAAWVTLYCDDASRTADLSRLETTDPTPGSGVIAEVTTSGAQTILMTPVVTGFNNDTTPGATIYAKVVNKSGTTRTITVTLTLLSYLNRSVE